jgi:uncharacterized protein YlxP (DUF503 family)
MSAYVCVIEAKLHIPESGSLESKRKVVSSIKAQLRNRFGAAVSEVGGQDTWQRSTLVCALVGDGAVVARADELERYVRSRCADNCTFERDLLSLADLRG